MARVLLIPGLGSVGGLRQLLPAGTATLALPAFSGPALLRYRPEDLADALDAQLPPEPCLVVGVSLGGSVALAMRSPWISTVVALDPPLHPETRPELMAQIEGAVLPVRPDLSRFFAEALAEYPIRTPARAWVLVGDDRAVAGMPTLCSTRDRARLTAAGARLVRVPGAGHDIAGCAPDVVGEVVAHALRELLS